MSIAAIVSLALGLYSDLGTPHTQVPCSDDRTKLCDKPRLDFVEGVAIVVAIAIVVLVGSLNDWQKEKQFQKLNAQKDDRTIKVIRDGKERVINVKVRFAILCRMPRISFPLCRKWQSETLHCSNLVKLFP